MNRILRLHGAHPERNVVKSKGRAALLRMLAPHSAERFERRGNESNSVD